MSNRDNIEKNTEHLAKRFAHLDHIGLIAVPSIDKVTIILEMTDPAWAVHSIQLLLLHSEHPIRIIALPGSLEFPSIQQYFAKEDPIEFWPYEAGIDRVNQAFVTIETPFVVLMEDRIMVTPRWLSSLIWPCLDEERVMIVSPMSPTEQFDGKLDLWFQSHIDLVSYAEEHNPRNQGLWRQVTMFTGSCLLFRRELLDDVGGFDPRLRSRELKVADWCLRARMITRQLALCEDVYVQALHSLQPRRGEKILSDEWDVFCSKWGMEREAYPFKSISELDISKCSIQPFISIHHEPLFITVFLVVSELLDTTFFEPEYSIQIEQTYSRIQWIGILIGEHHELPCTEHRIWDSLDALIKVREVEEWHEALEAAFMLAKGEVIIFMFAARAYESDYVTRVVDFMYRESADVVVNTGNDTPNLEAQVHIPKEPLPVPLSLTAHRRIQEAGSYVRSLEEYYFIPRASLRAVYWTKGTEDE